MSSFTWIRLQGYQSASFVSPVAVVTTLQLLAPSLPGPRTLPAQTMLTCATISTKGSPVPAPPAPTDISATNLDAPEPTLERTTMICPTQEPSQSQLAALAIPPEVVPNYLSKLSPSTPINIPLLSSYLRDHPDRALVDNLLTGLTQGFRIGFQGPRSPKEYSNLLSARDNPSIISKNILKEVQLGHTAGPFLSPPFPNLQVYPIGVVPKKHSSDWRTIFHLSYPKHHSTSVNAHISPSDYSLHYITVDNAISIIQNLGQGCFMSKLDIKSAFRNIPVHPLDWELLGMKWQGMYYFDTVLPFGLRSAPYLFDQFSCMLEWVIKTKLGIPYVIHILDDFFFVTKPPRSDCLTALCNILCLFTELDIPVAPGKTFPPSTSLEFMGVLLDSNKMEARLPLDKLTRTKEALHKWSHKKSATLKDLQSLIGTLQFACRVVVPGRAFLQRIISLTKGISNSRWHIKLNTEFRKDVSMWLSFLEHWNGVSFFLGDTVLSSPDLQLFTDASGSLGYGGYLNGQWFQSHWLPQHSLNPVTGISIDWQELFAIYIACFLWGPHWSGKRICFWCDNLPVVTIINSKRSKSSRIMDLVRSITILTLVHNFTFTAKHIPGLDNSIADSLSRFQMDRFHSLAPNASPTPCIIPPSAMAI